MHCEHKLTTYDASMASVLKHSKYRADIDGLRAIAILSVVGFHAFPSLFQGGFIGVDVFFVISGFLISTILFKGMESDKFSFIDFYRRRIRRIFPALIVVLISCLILGWFILFPDEYKQLGKHIAGGSGFISNYLLWNEAGYFDNSSVTKPLLHLWSLGIEEQFYIIWPLLIWVAWKKKSLLFISITLIAYTSFFLNIKNISTDAVATFYSPQTRFWELLCGSLVAWLMLYKQNTFTNTRIKLNTLVGKVIYRKSQRSGDDFLKEALSAVGLLSIGYGIFKLNETVPFPGIWALLPTLGAVLIILSGSNSWINHTLLSNRICVWLGLISFPLYLWHWPLLSFAYILEDGKPNSNIRIAVVLVSIILAWLTYLLIEKPIRFGKDTKTKTFLLIGLMSILTCIGYTTYKCNGFIFRFEKQEASRRAIVELFTNPYPAVKDLDCHSIPQLEKFISLGGSCRLSKNSPPEIVFIGDSHTDHYHNAVWDQFSSHSILMINQISCLPFSSSYFLKDDCKKKYNEVLDFLNSNTSIKQVYLSGYWAYLMTGGFAKSGLNWRSAKPLDPEGAKSFKENGRKFISSILKTNKEIIFLKDIPDLDFNIRSCYPEGLYRLSSRKKCSLNYVKYKKRVAGYDKVINELLGEFKEVKVYDPRPLFCKKDTCIVSDGSLPYYFNGDHLNYFGGVMVIQNMLQKNPELMRTYNS